MQFLRFGGICFLHLHGRTITPHTTLLPRRCWQQVHPKYWYKSTKLCSVMSQKTVIFMFATARISNLTNVIITFRFRLRPLFVLFLREARLSPLVGRSVGHRWAQAVTEGIQHWQNDNWLGRTDVIGEKSVPVSLYLLQIPYGISLVWACTSALRNLKPTAWAATWPRYPCCYCEREIWRV
jgi:hypothetical protein